jgi:hypothetical protein
MIISSSMEKEMWKDVVNEFITRSSATGWLEPRIRTLLGSDAEHG